MISMALLVGLQLGGEPSIVPELIMPRAPNRRLLPGRGWDVKLPRDFQVVGEDPAVPGPARPARPPRSRLARGSPPARHDRRARPATC